MINYSIIIPHKNTPSLLQKCIDSIPRREDVQIIVVDDNSDPRKVDFCNFPGLNDAAIEVYFTKNGRGAGFARNIGLRHAVGKWVVFADADDFFFSCINDAMDDYAEADVDIIFFKSKGIRLLDGEASHRGTVFNDCVDKALAGDFGPVLRMSVPWCKFIRRSVIAEYDLVFNESFWANDVVFMARLATCTSLYKASDMPIYCITESPSSLIQARSLESRIVRYQQELEGVRIYRRRFPIFELSYWLFYTWNGVYEASFKRALRLLPSAILVCGYPFVKELFKNKFGPGRIKRRWALRWERFREKYAERKWAVLTYPSFWHIVFWGPSKLVNTDNYLTARPNPGAGIGHQISNWHSGYYYSQLFGLRFACSNFAKREWQDFLGYNYGEISVDYLLSQGYTKVRLPMFEENNSRDVNRVRKIISSYRKKKVVYILEQDQPYHAQYDVIPFIRKKFFSAPARKKDRLIFDDQTYNIAIHVRRGDITIGQTNGDPNLMMRWQDNSYYVKVLSEVLPLINTSKAVAIYLFSQGKESDFEEFRQFGNVHLCLDTNPQEAFLSFVHADMLLTSKSSFSYKPALLNETGTKVCPRNFWHAYPDSNDWVLVEDDGSISPEEIAKIIIL